MSEENQGYRIQGEKALKEAERFDSFEEFCEIASEYFSFIN
ncbi:MAG: hypothetical protein BTN85_1244 [Candidatus Methanohalarchaeum thermophilum]|uniref:Uncharacterized protein n=1 Tax=Methanohalarchaeum thermophilum TaxID=1903181 RepID=A0A1Q6DWJ6_METT1|nr:MAG: hypothetical protein BTN85_1244 [Candidatus Methanohalarchaeum thermophilum]